MARPGPRRPQSLEDSERTGLLEQARSESDAVEQARQQMLVHARRRQDLVLRLYDGGVSVRDIAVRLDVSAAVVQSALTVARGRAPKAG